MSSDTYGARWMGKVGESLSYNLEYAVQSDAADSAVNYDADYLLAEINAVVAAVKFGVGYELLGSDAGRAAFNTLLATLHKFQGWTDRFLTTSVDGVKDFYVSAAIVVAGIKLAATYHDLTSDYAAIDYGQEFDVSAAKKWIR